MCNRRKRQASYDLASLAFWCAGLPIIAVHTSYLISALSGQVEWCFPYIDSCTSISNAGRKHPAQIIFKSMLSMTAVLMFLYWIALVHWLRALEAVSKGACIAITLMGTYAGLALILYCVTLGSEVSQQKELRRIGIVLFFSLTAFAHLLTVYQLNRHFRPRTFALRRALKWQKSISYFLVCLGLISGLLSGLANDLYKRVDDAIEWSFALPMSLQFLVTGLMWKMMNYQTQLKIGNPEK